MKNIFKLFLLTISILTIFSCKEDDSLAISQDQLLRAHKWQLKEIRIAVNNVTTVDKLVDCERQSTLDFTDIERFYSVAYKTVDNNCVQSQTDGTYVYNTANKKRELQLKMADGTMKTYYMNQLDQYYLILQETIRTVTNESGTTTTLQLSVYQPVK